MKRLLIIMSLLLMLAGCSMSGREYLDYTCSSFSAAVEGSMNKFEFSAQIIVGPPCSDGSENTGTFPRDIEMTFTSPKTLNGVKIVRKDGKITVFSVDMAIESSEASGWLAAAELLTPDGRINNVKIVMENDSSLAKVEMTLADSAVLILFIDCNTGFPVSIESADIEIRITAFGN